MCPALKSKLGCVDRLKHSVSRLRVLHRSVSTYLCERAIMHTF